MSEPNGVEFDVGIMAEVIGTVRVIDGRLELTGPKPELVRLLLVSMGEVMNPPETDLAVVALTAPRRLRGRTWASQPREVKEASQ